MPVLLVWQLSGEAAEADFGRDPGAEINSLTESGLTPLSAVGFMSGNAQLVPASGCKLARLRRMLT